MPQGSQFDDYRRFFIPVIDALKELGGSGRPAEVLEKIAERLHLSEEELNQKLKDGTSRLANQLKWARWYLVKTGYLSSSTRGVWTLSEKGQEAELAEGDIPVIACEGNRIAREQKGGDGPDERFAEDEQPAPVESYRATLLEVLRKLPPAGFEKLCQRLLRRRGILSPLHSGTPSRPRAVSEHRTGSTVEEWKASRNNKGAEAEVW